MKSTDISLDRQASSASVWWNRRIFRLTDKLHQRLYNEIDGYFAWPTSFISVCIMKSTDISLDRQASSASVIGEFDGYFAWPTSFISVCNRRDYRSWWSLSVKRNIRRNRRDYRSWWSLSVKRNIRRFHYNYSLFVDL